MSVATTISVAGRKILKTSISISTKLGWNCPCVAPFKIHPTTPLPVQDGHRITSSDYHFCSLN
jgi:hypothetical protein